MCWTHYVSRDAETRALIEKRLAEWIFGTKGLLSQWRASWFNFQFSGYPPDWDNSELTMSRLGLRPGWELAKSNGILHAFSCYLNHVNDEARLREKVELGLRYLSRPMKARMSGVCAETDESYGQFADQATGVCGAVPGGRHREGFGVQPAGGEGVFLRRDYNMRGGLQKHENPSRLLSAV